MGPKSNAQLHYYPSLPIETEPLYKDGFQCDFCSKEFRKGPFYHCTMTGTDCCVNCAVTHSVDAVRKPTATVSNASIVSFHVPSRTMFLSAQKALQEIVNKPETFIFQHGPQILSAVSAARIMFGAIIQVDIFLVVLSNGTNLVGAFTNGVIKQSWCVTPAAPTSALWLDHVRTASSRKSHLLKLAEGDVLYTITPAHFLLLFPWFPTFARETPAMYSSLVKASEKGSSTDPFIVRFSSLCREARRAWADTQYAYTFVLSCGTIQLLHFEYGVNAIISHDGAIEAYVNGAPADLRDAPVATSLQWLLHYLENR